MRNSVEFIVHGRYALFTDPITRMGGEKFSYQIPTYQALKGIVESIYWKPTFVWIIDEVRVLNRIQTEAKGIRPINYGGGNSLAFYTYLKDVSYQVKAHFVWNDNRKDLSHDRNEHKHHNVAKRMIERGGRRDVFFGARECQAYAEACAFGTDDGAYDGYGELDFGLMFHSFAYPDESGKNELGARLWRPTMKDGIIKFCQPDDCLHYKTLRPMNLKTFNDSNFKGLLEQGLLNNYPWEEEK